MNSILWLYKKIFVCIQYFKYSNDWDIIFEWQTWMFMFNTQWIKLFLCKITSQLLSWNVNHMHFTSNNHKQKRHIIYIKIIYILSYHFYTLKFMSSVLWFSHKLDRNSMILKVYDERPFKLKNYHLQKSYIVMSS
jgi:hypothetical protein